MANILRKIQNDSEIFTIHSLIIRAAEERTHTSYSKISVHMRMHRRLLTKDIQTKAWAKSMMLNIASAGKFSSDRTIEEYVHDIWKLEKVHIPDVK